MRMVWYCLDWMNSRYIFNSSNRVIMKQLLELQTLTELLITEKREKKRNVYFFFKWVIYEFLKYLLVLMFIQIFLTIFSFHGLFVILHIYFNCYCVNESRLFVFYSFYFLEKDISFIIPHHYAFIRFQHFWNF